MPGDVTEMPSARGAKPIDHDLYCLSCRYNLRGLSGDPVRCPECGEQNPRLDAHVSPEQVAEQTRQIKRLLGLAALAFLPGLALAALGTAAIYVSGGQEGCLWCPGLLGYGLLAYAWLGLQHFRTQCRGQRGWLGAAIWFWTIKFTALLLVLVPIVAINWGLGRVFLEHMTWGRPVHMLVFPVGYAAVIVYTLRVWPVVRRMQASADAPLVMLVEQAAREAAFEKARRRMARR